MTDAPRLLILANPASARGGTLELRRRLESFFAAKGVAAVFETSSSPEEIRERASRAAAENFTVVVALGGDGTFHHVFNGAYSTGIPLGVIPAGQGNDIASGLGVPSDAIAAADFLLRNIARPHRFDVLRVTFPDGYAALYAGAGGLGLDAEAAALANSRFRPWPGPLRYVLGALWTLRHFRPIPLTLEAFNSPGSSAENWAGEVLFAAFANAPSYGSGLRIAPAARMDDGILDITLVEPMPFSEILEALPVALRTGEIRSPHIRRFRASRVTFTPGAPALFHGDGELLSSLRAGSTATVEVLPASIAVCAPPPAITDAV